ncbi:MAG: type IV pili methyl-accepting chemotaxis transducer N-terminal domain-containing protein, partial [Gammaproteobacteria bacterium]
MLTMLKKSLLIRLALVMGTIVTLAFIGMLSSVFVAETSEGQASAINQAGTLRMQSYRIALDVANYPEEGITAERIDQTYSLINEFHERLYNPRLTGALAKTDTPRIHTAYNQVTSQWGEVFLPKLEGLLQQLARDGRYTEYTERMRFDYLVLVDGLVAHVHEMIDVLEYEVETRIRLLRLIQIISLFLTTLVVSITMYMMHFNVMGPLRELLGAAKGVQQGDFSQRVDGSMDDELGQLGQAFNMMAEDLSKMYADLEKRVKEKTCDLERSNRSLELLYKVTRRLSEAPLTDEVYTYLLEDIEKLVGTGPGSICLGQGGDDCAYKLASTRQTAISCTDLFNPPDCGDCLKEGAPRQMLLPREFGGWQQIFSIPIRDHQQQYGVLLVDLPSDGEPLHSWQKRLLTSVASHIAIALNINRRASQARMLALLEERSVIARELHDSLAQSLSYLKIQVTRLDAAITQVDNQRQVRAVTAELRDGLNSAYRQLRELLTTFRLKIDEAGLNEALKKTVVEFSQHSQVAITLDNQMGGCRLRPNA